MLPVILVAVGAYLIGDSVLQDTNKYAKGGEVGFDEDIKETKRLITAFIKKYGHIFPMNEINFIKNLEAQDYLGHGASSYNYYTVTSNIEDKLAIDETKPKYGALWLKSDINPNGISGKDDVARTYTIHLEIKGRKRLSQRSYDEDGLFFKIYDYGRTIAEVLEKVEDKMYQLETKIRKYDLRFFEVLEKGGYMAKGGKTKMPEWAVTITSEDGDSYDWDGFAKSEDDALYKAEQEAGFDSVESSVIMITDENGEKIEYAKGGALKNWEDEMKGRKDIEFLRIERKEKLPNGNLMIYYKYNTLNELETTKVGTDVIKMAKGGKLVGKQKKLDVNKNGKLDAQDFKMLRSKKMDGGGLVVNSDEDLREVAKYMAKAVKKRWDFKDLVYYFEKDNNYDYHYRVKIWDEMNVYEMKKTEDNIYNVLKAIKEANEAKK